MNLIKNWKGTD